MLVERLHHFFSIQLGKEQFSIKVFEPVGFLPFAKFRIREGVGGTSPIKADKRREGFGHSARRHSLLKNKLAMCSSAQTANFF